MVQLAKATFGSNIWETIKDRITTGVTSVTLADTSTQTIQRYTSSFPDSEVDSKSSYPIIVIEIPSLSWDPHTFTKKYFIGTISVSIYTTKAEAGNLFIDKVIDSLETYRTTIGTLGVQFFDLENTSYDSAIRGGFKVHLNSANFTFKYAFTKTSP